MPLPRNIQTDFLREGTREGECRERVECERRLCAEGDCEEAGRKREMKFQEFFPV